MNTRVFLQPNTLNKDKAKSCNHTWITKYSHFGASEGVQWYCANRCGAILGWPEAKNRVNSYPSLVRACLDTITRIEWYIENPADRSLDAGLATLRLALEKAGIDDA